MVFYVALASYLGISNLVLCYTYVNEVSQAESLCLIHYLNESSWANLLNTSELKVLTHDQLVKVTTE
jgi:hypothetical protein